jgi:hypothetical protein
LAKTKLPDPLSRRYLLERELDPARARAVAEAYLAQGREIEAIEFLARGDGRESLAALRAAAVERGDVFLMRAVAQALDEEPDAGTWRALGEAASRAGRERDADTAARLATVDG